MSPLDKLMAGPFGGFDELAAIRLRAGGERRGRMIGLFALPPKALVAGDGAQYDGFYPWMPASSNPPSSEPETISVAYVPGSCPIAVTNQ